MKPILVFDTETTGLTLHPSAPIDRQPKIIEFGAALLCPETAEILDTINLLIHPGEHITDEITKITGITDADLEGAPTFPQVVEQIAAFFSRAGSMVAHNLPFDRAMLTNELTRHGVEGFPWPAHGVCTVGLYKDEWGRNPKMLELYEAVLGRPLAQTHRALDDVRALVEIIAAEGLAPVLRSPE